jgi:hypothetical protein
VCAHESLFFILNFSKFLLVIHWPGLEMGRPRLVQEYNQECVQLTREELSFYAHE